MIPCVGRWPSLSQLHWTVRLAPASVSADRKYEIISPKYRIDGAVTRKGCISLFLMNNRYCSIWAALPASTWRNLRISNTLLQQHITVSDEVDECLLGYTSKLSKHLACFWFSFSLLCIKQLGMTSLLKTAPTNMQLPVHVRSEAPLKKTSVTTIDNQPIGRHHTLTSRSGHARSAFRVSTKSRTLKIKDLIRIAKLKNNSHSNLAKLSDGSSTQISTTYVDNSAMKSN